jgi:hypothetical protein
MIKITFILPDEFGKLASQDGYDLGAYIQLLLFNPLIDKYRDKLEKKAINDNATQIQNKVDKATGELDAKIKYFAEVVCYTGVLGEPDYLEKTFTLETDAAGNIIEAPPAGYTVKG